MCCFVMLLGLLGPRFAFLYTWIFTTRVQLAFSGAWLLPTLGLLIAPWTALIYVLAYAPLTGVSTLGWCFVGLGVLFDLGMYSSRSAQQRYNGRGVESV